MLDNILDFYDWLADIRGDLTDSEEREKCIKIMSNVQKYLDKHGPFGAVCMIIDIMSRETANLDSEDTEAWKQDEELQT